MTGGAGIAGVVLVVEALRPAAASAAAATSASRLEGVSCSEGRSMLDAVALSGGGSLEGGRKSSGRIVDRRNSDSLAILPRLLRRKGMMVKGGQDHHSFKSCWVWTAGDHAIVSAMAERVEFGGGRQRRGHNKGRHNSETGWQRPGQNRGCETVMRRAYDNFSSDQKK